MVRTVSLHTDILDNRELHVTLPAEVPVGPANVVIVVSTLTTPPAKTFGDFLDSEFAGIWKDRTDITDSATFACNLREEAWRRSS